MLVNTMPVVSLVSVHAVSAPSWIHLVRFRASFMSIQHPKDAPIRAGPYSPLEDGRIRDLQLVDPVEARCCACPQVSAPEL